jgi:ketosteroid isomerase-like protein
VSPVEVARSYLSSFASGDADLVASHVSEDFINEHTSALGSSCEGRGEYRLRLPGFIASLPGLRYEVEDIVADGDRVVAAYLLTAEVSSRPIRIRGVMRMWVRDGLIARRVDYWDSKSFLDQVGG